MRTVIIINDTENHSHFVLLALPGGSPKNLVFLNIVRTYMETELRWGCYLGICTATQAKNRQHRGSWTPGQVIETEKGFPNTMVNTYTYSNKPLICVIFIHKHVLLT